MAELKPWFAAARVIPPETAGDQASTRPTTGAVPPSSTVLLHDPIIPEAVVRCQLIWDRGVLCGEFSQAENPQPCVAS
jgi:hypothetical protein